MGLWWWRFAALVRAEAASRARARTGWIAGVCFGVLWVLVAGIALDGTARLPAAWWCGLLWLGVLCTLVPQWLADSAGDAEMGATSGLLLAPLDRSWIFYARWCVRAGFACLTAAAVAGTSFIILNEPPPRHPAWFAAAFVSGVVVLSGLGTFLATLATVSRSREAVFPLLLIPVALPVILASVRLTVYAAASYGRPQVWWEVLLAYFVLLCVLPWLLYEPALEE
ncbi:cytochrome C biogenesis protein B [Alicyclobacillus cellulosilyticus]|uniref:Cytochrome C biogenesis protein B n=1 Tax=Alicyclobacillus cellulosilyticus TaxID=1003997 RepID=A0A917K0D7_9BACL|nr:heme exporter protein CcmB [Alicyclobacillus cellulosilyticus]GGI95722.1 cytochrome C biogenesis protein B [Alicyclobacillus cellulosilyticus]